MGFGKNTQPHMPWYRQTINAKNVVIESFVVLDNIGMYTVRECTKADRHNVRLYNKQLRLAQKAERCGLVLDPIPKPPHPTNKQRLNEWKQHNTPVKADLQSVAVETLFTHGLRVLIDYQPQDAIQTYRDNYESSITPQIDHGRYIVFSDNELRTKTKKQCLKADAFNNRLYARSSRVLRRLRHDLASVSTFHMNEPMQSQQSNFQRRIHIKNRDTLVSALEQARAIEILKAVGLVLYRDYEPQNAIGLSKQNDVLRDMMIVLGSRTPALPSAPSSEFVQAHRNCFIYPSVSRLNSMEKPVFDTKAISFLQT